MSISIEAKAVGDGIAIILPQALLDRLHIRAGDRLTLDELEDGFAVTPGPLTFGQKLATAERIMEKRSSLLRRLAE